MDAIETERLILRKMNTDDAAFLLALMNERGWLEFIGNTTVKTLEDAKIHILNRLTSRAEGMGFRVVTLKESHIPVGVCGLIQRDFLQATDIGYAFSEAYWYQGYAFEAALAMLHYGRDQLDFKRILAITDMGNQRSEKLLAKLGLVFESTMIHPQTGVELNVFAVSF
ncbi:GNAT family N-acetyltransferase [Aquirhabdus sp.]|uniref:GNAT family N-acetyltransferase n=1 Tax=Aquirhabdus sp. TaxID=2824160 RepID=UPI00396C95CA